MPLLEEKIIQPTPADGAQSIRMSLIQATNVMESSLAQIRFVVDRYGRQEIASALGADAAELKTVYDKLKSCLESVDSSRQIVDLPS